MRKRVKIQQHKPRIALNLSLDQSTVERVKLHALIRRMSVSRLIELLIHDHLSAVSIRNRACATEGQGGQQSDIDPEKNSGP